MKPSTTNPLTAFQGGTSKLLASLEQATADSILNLQQDKTGEATLEQKIDALQIQMEEAGKIQDKQERQDRMRILTATMEQLRAEDQTEMADFANAVMGLDTLMNSIGGDFEKLMQPSAEENRVLQNAQSAVKEAESLLTQAGGKWTLFGLRDRAVKAAEAQLANAKNALAQAEIRVKQMARQRLMSATIEESMQQYVVMVDKTVRIMQERHKVTSGQLKILAARKKAAFQIKNDAANALERLTEELNALEADLQAAEATKATMINGSQEYVAQEEVVSNLKAKTEEVRGKHNTAHTIFLSKERFCSELEIHEVATQRTFDTQKVWIAKALSDSEERQITFVSRVEQMKAMNDFDVIQNQDAVGMQMDRSNASYMATSSAIADRARMKMLEGHPDQMKALEVIRSAQAEHIQQIREREGEMIKQFETRWGINPFSGSYLNAGASTPTA